MNIEYKENKVIRYDRDLHVPAIFEDFKEQFDEVNKRIIEFYKNKESKKLEIKFEDTKQDKEEYYFFTDLMKLYEDECKGLFTQNTYLNEDGVDVYRMIFFKSETDRIVYNLESYY